MQATNSKSAVFGLNWLMDMEVFEVAGAYDPEQEMWIEKGSVSISNSVRGTATHHNTFCGELFDIDPDFDTETD